MVPTTNIIIFPSIWQEFHFQTPLGMAAGFDKNGEVTNALFALGFGFTEVGTVTPRPQSGNPRPRIFRLIKDKVVINRLGFNNQGYDSVLANLVASKQEGIVGVNIGANKDSENFVDDYISGIKKFWRVARYFTANISSPNTPGLRNLQSGEALLELLQRITATRDELAAASGRQIPMFLKIAPDLDESSLDEIADSLNATSMDGLIISNTTIARPFLHTNLEQSGGLSGLPLFEASTIILAKMRQRMGRNFPIIGVGGIDSVESAWEKLEAGADLLQLYTGMVFQGPGLAKTICSGMASRLAASSFENISSLSSSKSEQWANKPLPKGF